MGTPLQRHRDSAGGTGLAVTADVQLHPGGRLTLAYRLSGNISAVDLPARVEPGRADGLWRHTCFEAFLRGAHGMAYAEFNFSPSGQWAAYRFSDYREGMQPIENMAAPAITQERRGETYNMWVDVDAGPLTAWLPGTWRMGLAAVIEDCQGAVSYWALAHADGKPDFHHADGFIRTMTIREEA